MQADCSWRCLAIIQPLAQMAVMVVIFGRIAKLPSDGVPYTLLVLAALIPWQFFANTVSSASASLVNNAT